MDFSKLLHNPFVLEHPGDVSDIQWLIVRGIGFLLVLWIILKFIIPMFFKQQLIDRQQNIVTAAEQVEQTMRETEQMRNDYRVRLERIEDEAEARMAEAIREAEDLRNQILAEEMINSENIVRRGEAEVSRERAKALVHLRSQFVEDIIGAAQYAASKSLDAPKQQRLVSDFVKNVGAKS
jgi:F0F1-type ATP synthase membrane subunit b/b'